VVLGLFLYKHGLCYTYLDLGVIQDKKPERIPQVVKKKYHFPIHASRLTTRKKKGQKRKRGISKNKKTDPSPPASTHPLPQEVDKK